jgi:hypothetical protein
MPVISLILVSMRSGTKYSINFALSTGEMLLLSLQKICP